MPTEKITRVRTGCWTCRQRGYRCDEGKPVCSACTRLGIVCQGYGIRLTWMQSTSRTKHAKARECGNTLTLAKTTPPHPVPVDAVEPLPRAPPSLLSPKDQFVLQHYFYTVSGILSSTHDRSINTYCKVILPMAMKSDMLLNTLLLVSTTHLALRYESYALELPHYRNRVLPGLIRCIDSWDGFDASILATIIMMSIHEVFEANPKNWSEHLKAAGKIISDYMAHCKEPNHDVRMLLDIFAYHNVLACVGTGHTTLFMDYYNSETWSALAGHRNAFLASVDKLLSLVAKLSMLASESTASWPTPNGQRAIHESDMPAAAKLKAELETWKPPQAIPDDACNTAEAMRHAGLLFYYKLTALSSSREHTAEISQNCRQILEYIDLVPTDSPTAASHLWPLYMAGFFLNHSTTPDPFSQDFVRRRLSALKMKRGLKTVDRVRDRLDQIWDCPEDGVPDLDAPLILI